jgi:F-type H+-transporting ATPase subunit delta
MAQNEFQVEAIGQVYAQALVNESQKQGNLAAVTEDVRGIGEVVRTNEGFRAFTQAVTITPEEHERTLQKVFGGRVEEITLQVLLSMARRGRLMFLRGMVEAFERVLDRIDKKIDVELTSAAALGEAGVERVRTAVNAATGKVAKFTTKVDAGLIGGIKLRIDDTLIDGSVATQLEHMREKLKRRGAEDLAARVKTAMA